jgi:hypothetical protein
VILDAAKMAVNSVFRALPERFRLVIHRAHKMSTQRARVKGKKSRGNQRFGPAASHNLPSNPQMDNLQSATDHPRSAIDSQQSAICNLQFLAICLLQSALCNGQVQQ